MGYHFRLVGFNGIFSLTSYSLYSTFVTLWKLAKSNGFLAQRITDVGPIIFLKTECIISCTVKIRMIKNDMMVYQFLYSNNQMFLSPDVLALIGHCCF